MPRKSKKSKKGSKRRSKKSSKRSSKRPVKKALKKKSSIFDPAQRAAARARALEARLYFQRAAISAKDAQLHHARELQTSAETELKAFKEDTKETMAFAALQHEHTVARLSDRLQELSTANANLLQEKNDLEEKLKNTLDELNSTVASRDAEISRLNEVIKESHYKYERIIGQFTDNLMEKFVESWDNEKKFIDELEGDTYDKFLKNGFLPNFDDES
ncbi:unnamed protein product [Mesocestoides corti]|uniref:Coiled-coil domain-containing protein 153 n=1 Tax=Mesocestoides corti TaxID=53468 RepID=A0A0R3UEV7_MESCO|nr:unnamed protein product [Mesocestoides corti]